MIESVVYVVNFLYNRHLDGKVIFWKAREQLCSTLISFNRLNTCLTQDLRVSNPIKLGKYLGTLATNPRFSQEL